MRTVCPRCGTTNPTTAAFCRNCGLMFTRAAAGGVLGPGLAPHPKPLPPPAGYQPVAGTAALHFRWEAAGMKVPGMPEADRIIQGVYRKGWEV